MSVINKRREITRGLESARSSRPGSFDQHFGFGQSLREFVEGSAQVYEEVVPVAFGRELERGLIWAGLGMCTGLVLLFAAPGLATSTTNTWVLPVLGLLATLKWWLVGPCLLCLGLYIHLYLQTEFTQGNQGQLHLATGLLVVGWSWISVLAIMIVPIVIGWIMAIVAAIVMFFVEVIFPILAVIFLIALFTEGPIVLLGFAALIFMALGSLIEWILDR